MFQPVIGRSQVKGKVKVKFILGQATKVQRVSRAVGVFFL